MRLSLAALALAFAATATQAFMLPELTNPFQNDPPETGPIKICGNNETDTLEILYIKISPDPPKRGEVLSIDAKGILKERVDEGSYIKLIVKSGVIKIIQKTLDFCEESANINKPCPLEKGEHELKHEVTLPKEIPFAVFTAHVEVFDQANNTVTCLEARVDFRPRIPHF
ncbi:Phosphatidylglycerol/phosphatidylinositol transfer protein [Actinomortierella ambigua]|nr:Phosphatidylglycerol/phosphatidylinositol transfer protein [Actinomortierella ambigua]